MMIYNILIPIACLLVAFEVLSNYLVIRKLKSENKRKSQDLRDTEEWAFTLDRELTELKKANRSLVKELKELNNKS